VRLLEQHTQLASELAAQGLQAVAPTAVIQLLLDLPLLAVDMAAFFIQTWGTAAQVVEGSLTVEAPEPVQLDKEALERPEVHM
jgi:hypothetical protein